MNRVRGVHLERVSPHKWSARIRHPITGKQLRITDESEAKIQVRIDQIKSIKSDYRLGVIGAREAEREISLKLLGAPMVRDLWDAYVVLLHGQHATNTAGLWKVRLKPYFDKSRVFDLTAERMARWEKDQIAKGAAPKTILNAFWSLKTAIKNAIPHRVDEIPWQKWRPRGRVSGDEQDDRECVRSLPELGALLRAARIYDEEVSANKGYSDAAVRILFLCLTGCRQSEAAAMGWDHILFDNEPMVEMRIWYKTRTGWRDRNPNWKRPLDTPKMNKRRTQNLHPAVTQVLKLHRDRLERLGWYRPDGPVFPGHNGAWRTCSNIMDNSVFRKIVEIAGLPNPERWVVHSTRHSFGTLEAQVAVANGDIKGFLERGGWSKIETAMGYYKKGGRGRTMPFIGELSQGDLPGLAAAPSAQEQKMLEQSQKRSALLLAEMSESAVVPERMAEKSMTTAKLAALYPNETELPVVVAARAKSRYSRAYQQAKRDGKTVEQCQEAGNEAMRGFRAGFRGLQKRARAKLATETPSQESEPTT